LETAALNFINDTQLCLEDSGTMFQCAASFFAASTSADIQLVIAMSLIGPSAISPEIDWQYFVESVCGRSPEKAFEVNSIKAARRHISRIHSPFNQLSKHQSRGGRNQEIEGGHKKGPQV
jgi:hypothetical protein